jgi:hypothetical protein
MTYIARGRLNPSTKQLIVDKSTQKQVASGNSVLTQWEWEKGYVSKSDVLRGKYLTEEQLNDGDWFMYDYHFATYTDDDSIYVEYGIFLPIGDKTLGELNAYLCYEEGKKKYASDNVPANVSSRFKFMGINHSPSSTSFPQQHMKKMSSDDLNAYIASENAKKESQQQQQPVILPIPANWIEADHHTLQYKCIEEGKKKLDNLASSSSPKDQKERTQRRHGVPMSMMDIPQSSSSPPQQQQPVITPIPANWIEVDMNNLPVGGYRHTVRFINGKYWVNPDNSPPKSHDTRPYIPWDATRKVIAPSKPLVHKPEFHTPSSYAGGRDIPRGMVEVDMNNLQFDGKNKIHFINGKHYVNIEPKNESW